MTMTIDAHHQRFGTLHFVDHMSSYSNHPHFSNPWAPATTAGSPAGSQALFVGGHDGSLPHLNLNGLKHAQPVARTGAGTSTSLPSYPSLPVSSSAASGGSSLMTAGVHGPPSLLGGQAEVHSMLANRMPHPTSSPSYDSSAYSSSYEHLGYAQAPIRATYAMPIQDDHHSRRYSSQSVASSLEDAVFTMGIQAPRNSFSDCDRSLAQDDRKSFQDALEASHGMLSMSQETPRNIYDVRNNNRARGSADSYGFPSTTHSASSSVSSAGFSPYFSASMDGSSVSDYSTGSDIESLSGRTLPRPQLLTARPPEAATMMGSFNSKAAATAQKKHKCKVCDKRFTRPSSLQTHMYSHTGEKPFACPVPGCERHFSVVSNLRRHRKVHKDQDGGAEPTTPSDAGSEDRMSEDQSEDQQSDA